MLAFITDFGYKDVYAGIMKIVAKEICSKSDVVDVTHGITPFNILEGAIATLVTLPHLPKNSTLVVVVDPGVGSSREPVVAEIGPWKVVGPNNGVLWLAAQEYGHGRVVRIEKRVSKYHSYTFHGRDIFAPAGALLECGEDLENLGSPTKLQALDIRLVREMSKDKVRTTVVYIDHFGNVMTWYKGNPFNVGDRVIINDKVKAKVVKTFAEVGSDEVAVYVNSFGYLEIGVFKGNASKELGVNVGEIIEMRRVG